MFGPKIVARALDSWESRTGTPEEGNWPSTLLGAWSVTFDLLLNSSQLCEQAKAGGVIMGLDERLGGVGTHFDIVLARPAGWIDPYAVTFSRLAVRNGITLSGQEAGEFKRIPPVHVGPTGEPLIAIKSLPLPSDALTDPALLNATLQILPEVISQQTCPIVLAYLQVVVSRDQCNSTLAHGKAPDRLSPTEDEKVAILADKVHSALRGRVPASEAFIGVALSVLIRCRAENIFTTTPLRVDSLAGSSGGLLNYSAVIMRASQNFAKIRYG